MFSMDLDKFGMLLRLGGLMILKLSFISSDQYPKEKTQLGGFIWKKKMTFDTIQTFLHLSSLQTGYVDGHL